MRPIGGYFELDARGNSFPHQQGVLLNSGSYALSYIIRKLAIKHIWLPDFTCPIVPARANEEHCEISTYTLDHQFMPSCALPKDDFIVYNNWFGVLGKNVATMCERHPNLIVDNAQAFYAPNTGVATLYSPRKFFGVPDGGIAVFKDDQLNEDPKDMPQGVSYDHSIHLLKRIDLGPTAAYEDFHADSKILSQSPMQRMSQLTSAMLSNVDFDRCAEIRKQNFEYLDANLHTTFPLAMDANDVPLVYPYVTDDQNLRRRLIEENIFVATYWPGVKDSDWFVNHVLPLPIDQRYDSSDMNRILEVINA